jgi:hypothetical protein
MTLTDTDRRAIAKARELADAGDIASLQIVLDIEDETDPATVLAKALGVAQARLAGLADITERLEAETSRLLIKELQP